MSLSSKPVSTVLKDEGKMHVDIEPIDPSEPDEDQADAGRRDGADDEVLDGEDQPGEEEACEAPVCLPCPGAPSLLDRRAHELTHWPYRKWCEHCVRGRAVGPNSKRVPDDKREMIVPKAHLDYAYLQEELIEEEDEFTAEGSVRSSMTILVMLETLCESVWTYAVHAKGVVSDPWLADKLAKDLATAGVANCGIVVKTDTEPAIVDLRNSLAASRGGTPTAFDDSRVGDSNSNARIERLIRDVKGLIRTLRSDLQEKIGGPVNLESTVVPWIVRHAGYILTRCRVHPCGRTAMERIKGQKTHRPLNPFGEAVMFKIPKTKRRLGDFEDRFEKGIWLGMTVQSGENIVATAEGVYRVGGIIRCPPDSRWSKELVGKISGTPSEPKPGSGNVTIPTYAKQQAERDSSKDAKFAALPAEPKPTVRPAYIYANDVKNNGASEHCKACDVALKKGNSTGFSHTAACRLRFEEIFRRLGSERLLKADDRMNQAVFDASANVGASPTVAEEEEKMEDMDESSAPSAPTETARARQAREIQERRTDRERRRQLKRPPGDDDPDEDRPKAWLRAADDDIDESINPIPPPASGEGAGERLVDTTFTNTAPSAPVPRTEVLPRGASGGAHCKDIEIRYQFTGDDRNEKASR